LIEYFGLLDFFIISFKGLTIESAWVFLFWELAKEFETLGIEEEVLGIEEGTIEEGTIEEGTIEGPEIIGAKSKIIVEENENKLLNKE
jgi:hypothetical protein